MSPTAYGLLTATTRSGARHGGEGSDDRQPFRAPAQRAATFGDAGTEVFALGPERLAQSDAWDQHVALPHAGAERRERIRVHHGDPFVAHPLVVDAYGLVQVHVVEGQHAPLADEGDGARLPWAEPRDVNVDEYVLRVAECGKDSVGNARIDPAGGDRRD